jgi:hypothetical protein
MKLMKHITGIMSGDLNRPIKVNPLRLMNKRANTQMAQKEPAKPEKRKEDAIVGLKKASERETLSKRGANKKRLYLNSSTEKHPIKNPSNFEMGDHR